MARYTPTFILQKLGSRLFKVYVNEKGEEGVFVTFSSRRVFVKIRKSLEKRINRERVEYWRDIIRQMGGATKLKKDPRFPVFGSNPAPKAVHPAFSKLIREWSNPPDVEWYRDLIDTWHHRRPVARRRLQSLITGRTQNPFWDEVSALNRAILLEETKRTQGVLQLYRGVSLKKYLGNILEESIPAEIYRLPPTEIKKTPRDLYST